MIINTRVMLYCACEIYDTHLPWYPVCLSDRPRPRKKCPPGNRPGKTRGVEHTAARIGASRLWFGQKIRPKVNRAHPPRNNSESLWTFVGLR